MPRDTPLLPYQKVLAAELGLTDEQYRWFLNEIESQVRVDPAQPQAAAVFPFLLKLVIGVGLTLLASFLKPGQKNIKPAQIGQAIEEGGNVTSNRRVVPRYGFNSLQEPARFLDVVPVVYAHRQNLPALNGRPAGYYGGVRVNLPLIWSQMWSLQGSQLFRGIYLIGEGTINSVDPQGFAIGDNTLAVFENNNNLALEEIGKLAIYFRGGSGRITSADRIAGATALNDVANGENAGGADVFTYKGIGEAMQQGSCYTVKPATATTFGLYAMCRNGMNWRKEPRPRPMLNNYLNGNKVSVDDDTAALVDMWKQKYRWSCRSGIISSNGNPGVSAFEIRFVDVGDTFVYRLSARSDASTKITVDTSNSDIDSSSSSTSEVMTEVASAVAALQSSTDDAMLVGELYKAGSCYARLTSRQRVGASGYYFVSDADNEPPGGGSSMDYTFEVTEPGYIGVINFEVLEPSASGTEIKPVRYDRNTNLAGYSSGALYKTATNFPQVFRCARATISINKECRLFEVGLKSTVGINVQGYTNLKDCPPLQKINGKAGQYYDGITLPSGGKLNTTIYQAGTISTQETRYSCFAVYYRITCDCWVRIPEVFAVAGDGKSAIYNYLRFEMPSVDRWEIDFRPISGWEIRQGVSADMIVLDGRTTATSTLVFGTGYKIYYSGERYNPGNLASLMRIKRLEPTEDLGYGFSDDATMLDDWARVAEGFCYDSVRTSAEAEPEHEISYVNIFTDNPSLVTYPGLGKIGLHIGATKEMQQLGQFSAYVTGAKRVRLLLGGDAYGPSHLFPDLLRDAMLADESGDWREITESQIDVASFRTAAQWCFDRRYFYDGAITEKINVRKWAEDVCATNLLELTEVNGKFALRVLNHFTTPMSPRALFNAGNKRENTFKLDYLDDSDRRPIQVAVKWRQERRFTSGAKNGMFPVEQTVLVREASGSASDPIETFDLSAYCTNEYQAIDFACYVIRLRRLSTHTCGLELLPDSAAGEIASGDYVETEFDYTSFNAFANGIVRSDGILVTARPDLMPPGGSYSCVTWDGSSPTTVTQNVTVAMDGTASPAGILFAKKETGRKIQGYKIEKLGIDPTGSILVQMSHWPTDGNGYSLVFKDWTTYDTDANWIIQR